MRCGGCPGVRPATMLEPRGRCRVATVTSAGGESQRAIRDRGALLKAERVLCNELNVADVRVRTLANPGYGRRYFAPPQPCARHPRISLDISEVYEIIPGFTRVREDFSSSSRD